RGGAARGHHLAARAAHLDQDVGGLAQGGVGEGLEEDAAHPHRLVGPVKRLVGGERGEVARRTAQSGHAISSLGEAAAGGEQCGGGQRCDQQGTWKRHGPTPCAVGELGLGTVSFARRSGGGGSVGGLARRGPHAGACTEVNMPQPSTAAAVETPVAARRTIPHLRWLICGLLFIATTINYVDRQTVSVLSPLLRREIGW